MRPSPLYSVVAGLSWPVFRLAFRLTAHGRENLPESGGFVLASNHISNIDPWPLGLPLWPRRQLRFMAKAELYRWPLRFIVDGAGAFPVRRGERDLQAIATAIDLARDGNVVAMFPEGTRRAKGLHKRHEARPRSGAARIALEAGVPLVPAAVRGTDALRRLGKLTVVYGRPVDIEDLRGHTDTPAAAREATGRLMEAIYALEADL